MLQTRRRILALFMPIAGIFLLVGQALTPKGLDKPLTSTSRATHEVAIAAAHSGILYFSNLLVIFGIGALGVSFAAIAALVRERYASVATAAAVIGGFGAFCGAIVNVLIGLNLAAAASSHATVTASAQVLVAQNTATVSKGFLIAYLACVFIAVVLTGLALWQSHATPPLWAALFVVSSFLGAASPPGILAIPLSLPLLLTMVLLATRVWNIDGTPASPTPDPTGRLT